MIKYKSLNEFFPEGRADGSWFIQKDQEEMIEFQPFFRHRNQRWVGLNSSGFYTIVGVDQLWKQVILNDVQEKRLVSNLQ